jgi:hypothetical protein
MWGTAENESVAVSYTEVIDGDPRRIWSPHAPKDDTKLKCRYVKGEVVQGEFRQLPMAIGFS